MTFIETNEIEAAALILLSLRNNSLTLPQDEQLSTPSAELVSSPDSAAPPSDPISTASLHHITPCIHPSYDSRYGGALAYELSYFERHSDCSHVHLPTPPASIYSSLPSPSSSRGCAVDGLDGEPMSLETNEEETTEDVKQDGLITMNLATLDGVGRSVVGPIRRSRTTYRATSLPGGKPTKARLSSHLNANGNTTRSVWCDAEHEASSEALKIYKERHPGFDWAAATYEEQKTAFKSIHDIAQQLGLKRELTGMRITCWKRWGQAPKPNNGKGSRR